MDEVLATAAQLKAGQALFHGRYVLERKLGQGGMGVVWLARDGVLERAVALKFLPEMLVRDDAALGELRDETRRSLELTHPNILRIYDFEQDEEAAAISMEFVDGGTLASFRAAKPQRLCEPADMLPWLRQLCEALHYAHTEPRIVHRDLKPANLMLNARGQLKVADFGIARCMTDSVSRVSLSIHTSGTPAYMSPQQLMGQPSLPADDIYAVGATLYDLLTSKPPFYTGSILAQVQDAIPPRMEERRRELGKAGEPLPEVWETVVAACLAKEPTERPATTLEIWEWIATGQQPARRPVPMPMPLIRHTDSLDGEPLSVAVTAVTIPETTRSGLAAPPPPPPTTSRFAAPAPPAATAPAPRTGRYLALIGVFLVLGFGALALAVGGYLWYSRQATQSGPVTADDAADRPSAEVPTRTAPEPPSEAERPAPPPQAIAPEPAGLVVNTVPSGAVVSVDGQQVGISPVSVEKLPPGTHRVRMEASGYEPQELAAVLEGGKVKEIGPVSLRAKATPAPVAVAPPAIAPPMTAPRAPIPADPSRSLATDASRRKLSKAELAGLSQDQLWRARNEIYARYGLIFTTERGRAFARSLGGWYRGVDPDQDRVFKRMSALEQYNVELIKSLENGR